MSSRLNLGPYVHDPDNVVHKLLTKPKKNKGSNVPHYPNFPDNYFHQADLLILPEDPSGYDAALVVVDVGSRIVDATPVNSKKSSAILSGFKRIYKRGILKPPTNVISFDGGSEFKGDVSKYFSNVLKVHIKVAKPGRHTQQAIVERKNKDIGDLLFRHMTAVELATGKINKEWIKNLPHVIKSINRMNPKKKRIMNPPVKYFPDNDLLLQGTKVRYAIDQPINTLGEKLSGPFRETDIRFSIKPKTITHTIITPNNPTMYILNNDMTVQYTRNQLQPYNEKEKLPKIIRTDEDYQQIEKLSNRKKLAVLSHFLLNSKMITNSKHCFVLIL
jgi:hypothetical protein